MSQTTECVFCRIAAGELPAHVVYEDDRVMAIMDQGHVNPGHTLVLAKGHAETMMDLDEDTAAQAFRIANRVSKVIEQTYAPDGQMILQANRPAGFQTVGHFHLHVLPRYEDDGVELTWPAKNPPQEELAVQAERVRTALAEA
jgi:histidine triad (HIT) family protein